MAPARLRVVAGTAGGQRLATPRGIRPTAARVREALFATLGDFVTDVAVLDLYAGSGALAIEALSRGAARAVLVDADAGAVKACEANVATIGFGEQARVRRARVAAFLAARPPAEAPFALVLLDPPYGTAPAELPMALDALSRPGWLTPDARVVVEQAAAGLDLAAPAALEVRSRRPYGDTLLITLGPSAGS